MVTLKIFWACGMTDEFGPHPLSLVKVIGVGPSRFIGKIEWRLHSSVMDGLQLARSLMLHGEDVHCNTVEILEP